MPISETWDSLIAHVQMGSWLENSMCLSLGRDVQLAFCLCVHRPVRGYIHSDLLEFSKLGFLCDQEIVTQMTI